MFEEKFNYKSEEQTLFTSSIYESRFIGKIPKLGENLGILYPHTLEKNIGHSAPKYRT